MAIYMKTPFATGSVTATGYIGWVELDSVHLGVAKTAAMEVGSLQSRGSSVPKFSGISLSKSLEEASPGILNEVVNGMTGHAIEIAVLEAGDNPKEYVRFKLKNAIVTSYDISATGLAPHESLVLNYEQIEVKFTPHDTKNTGAAPSVVSYNLANPE